jgi:hypothetical protein
MRTSAALRLAASGAAALLAAPAIAAAGEEELLERIEQLELRIQDLEASQPPAPSTGAGAGGGGWTRHLRLGGSANAGYFGGEPDSLFEPDAFQIWDARLFLDAQLGDDVSVAEHTVFRNVGFFFEWDLVRLGSLENRVGEMYADFQGFLDSDALSFQLGRFQIPVGEAYLRYSQGYAKQPFVSNAVGGPWWWDEGVRFYGSSPEHGVGYVSSISNGSTPFNEYGGDGTQLTLKLFWRPLSWLYVSASGLRTGQLGSSTTPASGALWLGESWARAFGASSSVPNYQDSVEVVDGPNQLDQTWLAAGDVVLDFAEKARIWLAYGRYTIDSRGGEAYDRVLHYWIAEAILRGAWLSRPLAPFYLGVRANALGTFDGDAGYLLDFRRSSQLGFNMESLTAYSTVLGWDLTSNLRLRVEYTFQDIDLVRGVSLAVADAARRADFFAIELGASF